jgi:hypothetical protein
LFFSDKLAALLEEDEEPELFQSCTKLYWRLDGDDDEDDLEFLRRF